MKQLKQVITIVSVCLWAGTLAAQPSSNKNYVIRNTIKASGITSQAQIDTMSIAVEGKSQTISYFDGLGRPIQTVATKASASQKDIITPVQYDIYGREVKRCLPYTDTANGYGGYKTNWTTNQPSFYNGILQGVDTSVMPYSQVVYEASPLNRLLAQGAPGSAWQPNLTDPYDTNARVIKLKYEINKAEDSVRLFNVDSAGGISSPGIYPMGRLTIKTAIDEHNVMTKEYSDMYGHLILKRQFIDGDSLQTYYIYDDFGLLTAIIQPEGVAAITSGAWSPDSDFMNKWMFLYRYDELSRMVMKKVPGADSVLMVYDKWDRLVLTQDGNYRQQHRWLYTKYDALNRPISTGEIMDTRSQDTIRAAVASSTGRYEMPRELPDAPDSSFTTINTFPSSSTYTLTSHTYSYYDSYSRVPNYYPFSFFSVGGTTQNIFTTGQSILTMARILGSTEWLGTASYYDDKYRIIQTTTLLDTGIYRVNSQYSFDGKLQNQWELLIFGPDYDTTVYTSQKQYNYDHADRLLSIVQDVDNTEEVTLIESTYNELGQLLTKKLHQSASHPSYLQKLDYSYNIRGWLNGINQPYGDGTGYDESDLFNFALHYNTTDMSGSTAQYNGNIAEQTWKGGYDEYLRGYEYTYDKANRLLKANYGFKYQNIYNEDAWDFTERYNEQVDAYDRNGNIQELERFHGAWTRIDDIHYQSWDGNKLLKVTDWQWPDPPVGYHDQDSWIDDFRYDQNGNMTFNFNKSVDTIRYNYLNLPDSIHFYGKGSIQYTYDCAGHKLRKVVIDTTGGATKVTTYEYRGPALYVDGQLQYIATGEGRIRPQKIDTTKGFSNDNLKYTYDYFLKDHLGNVRMVITPDTRTDLYAATEETATAAKENQLFTNLSSTQYAKPAGFDTDTSNHEVARLNGNITTTGNYRVGPSLIIKVMAGDTVSVATRAWYSGPTQAPPTGLSPISDELVSLLSGGLEGIGATHGGAISTDDISGGVGDIIPYFLDNTQTYDDSKPKAFLNWMVVDEEFKKVNSTNHMGAVQVPTIGGGDTSVALIGPSNMVVRRDGWLYVYLSNESNQDVFFDNLVINHKRGPVEEKTNYYAFGMDIPGLSSHANTGGTGYSDNRYKYNGKELQNNEFNDGSGLDWADYGARMYDPEIARWMVIDPLSEQIPEYNPYNYCIDEPTKFIDPDGRWFRVNYGYQTYDDGSFKTDKSGNKIAKFVDIKNADDLASAIENSGGNSYVKSFVDALNYITNNGADMGIVSSIIGDDQQINVSNPGGDQAWSYDNKKSQLDWNPDKGLAFQKGDEAKVSSPALLLLHEIGHAYVDIFSDKRDPNKTEDEQNRIINEAKESGETGFYFEKNAASKLGIDVRNKYTDGTRIGVTNGPLGTSPSTDPKQVLKNLDKWKEKKVKRNN